MLALAGAIALKQRRKRAPGAVDAGDNIADRIAHARRRPIRPAGDGHDTAHRLDDVIVGGAMGQRPVLAETGNADIDQARIERFHAFEIDAQTRRDARPEILDKNIGLLDQSEQQFAALIRFQIERDALLAAIDQHEIAALAADMRGKGAGIVAMIGNFDLGHRCTEIAQHGRAQRPRKHARQIQHLYSIQRPYGLRCFGHGSLQALKR